MADSVKASMQVEGLRETLAAFRRLPKAASADLRERTLKLSQTLADAAQRAGHADSPQSALVAPTIKARRDRVPVIQLGSAKRVGRNHVPAWKVIFGSEFGSDRLRQYRPHRGRNSYWFLRTTEREGPAITDAWAKTAEDIAREFGKG